MTRTDFVTAAAMLLGTPFRHQGRMPGIGLDCAGVVVCAANACGYKVADVQGYSRVPARGQFTTALLAHCDAIALDEALPGDLLMFAFQSEPQHIAILTGTAPLTLLHSYMQVGKVVEHDMDAGWRARLRGCYRLRGIE